MTESRIWDIYGERNIIQVRFFQTTVRLKLTDNKISSIICVTMLTLVFLRQSVKVWKKPKLGSGGVPPIRISGS